MSTSKDERDSIVCVTQRAWYFRCVMSRLTFIDNFLSCPGNPKAPVIWSRVPETALPPRQLYRAFICENVVFVGRVKVLPSWLFITFIDLSDVQILPFLWVSLGPSLAVGFACQFWPLWYEFLLQILNSGITWHSTLRELSRLGESKRLYEEKLPRLPGLPYPARWDNSPTRVVSPPETGLQT